MFVIFFSVKNKKYFKPLTQPCFHRKARSIFAKDSACLCGLMLSPDRFQCFLGIHWSLSWHPPNQIHRLNLAKANKLSAIRRRPL